MDAAGWTVGVGVGVAKALALASGAFKGSGSSSFQENVPSFSCALSKMITGFDANIATGALAPE